MTEKRVLMVEDEFPTRNFMTKAITNFGYEVTAASNGEEAFELFKKNPYPVVITDLNMPILNGEGLIDKINSMEQISPPTIIVFTSIEDIKKAIEVMKKKVFDYQIKPVNLNDLAIKLKNAFNLFELNRMQYTLEKEKELRLNEQLTWIRYKEDLKDKDLEKYKNNLMSNMKHNFGQAGGFGALVSLIELVYMSAKEEGDNFIISKEIINMIKENADILKRTLETMEKISYLSENPLDSNKMNVLDFYNIIENVVDSNKRFIGLNNNSIFISEQKPSFPTSYISIDKQKIIEVLDEIIRNACKFSEADSKIFFILRTNNDSLTLSILNEPSSQLDVRGIPIEYSNLVFEPFYRISKFVDERYETLNLGIGLSLVKAIIKKHGGSINISNIKDFTANNIDNLKVNLEIEIPLLV